MKHYLGILKQQKKPFRFLVAKALLKTGLCRILIIHVRNYKMHFHTSNSSFALWMDANEGEQDVAFLTAFLSSGDLVVDVGANIGEITLPASLIVGKTGKVIAFEPHPRIFSYLVRNVNLNRMSNVELLNIGVGDKPGVVTLSDSRHDDMNQVTEGRGISVKMDTLDNVLEKVGSIALLKVDVEGYEKFVLSGAAKLLVKTKCIYFEVSSTHFARFDYSMRELLEMIASYGFHSYRFESCDRLVPVTASYETEKFENLIAFRDLVEFKRRTGWEIHE